MTSINRHNYEEHILDYLEDNLSVSLRLEMEVFLELNPDIKEEIMGLEDIVLCKEDVSFAQKESLYMSEDASVFEDKCINYLENQYSQEEKDKFELELSLDRSKSSLLNDYKKTIVQIDESIVFENKTALKRNYPYRFKNLIQLSSAAAVLFAVSMSILLIPSDYKENKIMSEKNKVFDMPKEDIPLDIIEHPEITLAANKMEEEVKDNTNTSEEIKETKTLKIKAIKSKPVLVKIASNSINAISLIKEIDISQALASNEIVINKRSSVDDNIVANMSEEIVINENANEWAETSSSESKNSFTSPINNLIDNAGSKIKSAVGNMFYKKKISHTREIIIKE